MDWDTPREPRCSSAELIDRTHGSPARACPARPARSGSETAGGSKRHEIARGRNVVKNRVWTFLTHGIRSHDFFTNLIYGLSHG